ncbi:hypothetical protein Tco_0527918 [Tanacetum coccineum]
MNAECLLKAKIGKKEILKETIDPLFDEIPEDTPDHMETKNAQDVGRKRDIVGEEKENDENILSTEDVLSTDKEKVSIDKEKVSTDRPIVSTERIKVSDYSKLKVPMSKLKVLISKGKKEKGVELKDIEETNRPRPTSTRSLLTLKPLPKIDPKDKGKKKIEEEDESKRKYKKSGKGEEDRNSLAGRKTNHEASKKLDDTKGKNEADRLLAEKLQEEEREHHYTIEESAKFLHDTIAAQKKILPQPKDQKLSGTKFEEIQALYEKNKRSDEDFISIGSAEDERLIKKMNEKELIPLRKKKSRRRVKKKKVTERENLNIKMKIPEGFDEYLGRLMISSIHMMKISLELTTADRI